MLRFAAIFVGVLAVAYAQNKAIVLLQGESAPIGSILFTSTPSGLQLEGELHGLTPGKHGFHIHQLGDLRQGCASTGGHYNPHNRTHGAPEDAERHAGDLGNIVVDERGHAHVHIVDEHIALAGEHCVLGRAVVVHSGEDDLGKGGHKDSKTTGNAGGRVACGIIGVL